MAPTPRWKHNGEFDQLPEIEVGDRIALQDIGGMQHEFMADVIAISGGAITVRVVDIFFLNVALGRVGGGDIMEIKGQTLEVEPANVFKVVKRAGGQ
jgi:hypothetical protein